MQLKLSWAWMLPILLLSSFLGTFLINYDALWFDEWITLFITGTGKFETANIQGTFCEDIGLSTEVHTIAHTLCVAAIDNSWPPLYFLFQMAWDLFSGGNYFIDRSLALFMGLIAISVLYRLGKRLFSEKIGLAAALLLGTSVFFTFYMHEIRGYTLYVLVSALNGWLYWRLLLNHRAKRGLRWAFALSITLTLYTHYIGIAVIFGIGLYHLLFERKNLKNRVHWANILKLYSNGCLPYTLWIAVLIISYINSALLDRSIPLLDLLQGMMTGFTNNLTPIALILLLLALMRWKERPVQFLWAWSLTILAVAMLANIYADFLFHPRHIMGMMPAFMLLIVIGIEFLSQRLHPLAWSILGLWVGMGIFYSLSPSLMNNLPRHIDAVPLTAMNSIVETANQCDSSNSTFILGINTPDEEWVQDHPIIYYLEEYELKFVSLSRIMSDEWVIAQISPILPDELEIAGIEARYQYFTEGQNQLFLFTLPSQPIEAEIEGLQALLASDGFVECEPLINRPDLLGRVFVRDGASCQVVLDACSP